MAVDSSDEDECQNDVDMRTWIQEGVLANGNWQVSVDPNSGIGRSVYQTINHDPTFFVSPDTFMNVRIKGSIRVEDDWDNDFIGFVFGYNGPAESQGTTKYDFLLFDWKRETQNQEGRRGKEGLALAKVNGDLTGFDNMYDYFWQHDNAEGLFEIQAQDWGNGRGWEFNETYRFELIYTSTRISISIDGEQIFDQVGCYKSGRFGFYNFSQQSVRYSDFSYTLETNFETGGDVCLGQPSNFIFADSCYGDDNATANLRQWKWFFGDGSTSTDINPSHVYENAGTYEVKLWVEDKNGCTAEVIKTVQILPGIAPISLRDTSLCQGEEYLVSIDDPTISSYKWQDGSTDANYRITAPGRYWVDVSNGTCSQRAEFEVTYNSPLPPIDLGPNKQLCEGEELALNATLAGVDTYEWNDGSSAPMRTITEAGIYSVTLSNACGLVSDAIEVDYIAKPIVDIGEDVSVCEGESLTLNAELDNDDLSTTYLWTPNGSTTSSITVSPTQNTVYTVAATNQCGTNLAIQKVNVTPRINLQMLSTDVNCAGADDGRITINASGGAGDFVYSWMPNVGRTATVADLTAGNYTVIVRDAQGCTAEESIDISAPTPLRAALSSQTNVGCFGEENASLTLSAEGGVPGYSFALNGLAFTNRSEFSRLAAGDYTIVVRDQNDCRTTLDVHITQPELALGAAIAEKRDISCFGGNDGALQITAEGGATPYSYSLDGVSYSNAGNFEGLSEGAYIIHVKDANNCVFTIDERISQPEELTALPIIQQEINCFGANDGAATVSVEGGIAPYTYRWTNNVSNTASATGLPAGSYQINITDSRGCNLLKEVVFEEPQALTAGIETQSEINCYGEARGAVSLRAEGGGGNYSYSLDGINFVNNPTFTDLPAGDYEFVVRDQNDCRSIVSVELSQPESALAAIFATQTDIKCFGQNDGALLINAEGGMAPYTYTLNDQLVFNRGSFSELSAGDYTVEIKDAKGCIVNLTTTITQPEALTAIAAIQEEIACYGNGNGTASVQVAGGQAPYTYLWFEDQGGTQTAGFRIYGTDQTASDLAAGTYKVAIADANGCEVESEVTFTEPSEIVAVLDQVNDAKCFGDDNGLAKVSVDGGSAPYTYLWNTAPVQRTYLVAGLGAGTYEVIVSDRHGCRDTLNNIVVSQPEEIVLTTSHTDVKCFGGNDGTALVTVAGGSSPYSSTWNGNSNLQSLQLGGLTAGNHFVSVRDANGCVVEASVEITQPEAIDIELAELSNAYCSLPNGSALVSATGGSGNNYSYKWNTVPIQGSPLAMNLKTGGYSVTAMDAEGCTTTLDIMIGNTPPPMAKFTHNQAEKDSVQLREAKFDFRNLSVGALRYDWDFGDGSPISSQEHPTHAYPDVGTYTVVMTAYDAFNSCPAQDSMDIHIFHGGKLFTPNAFSPNEDGVNDIWYVKGEGIHSMQLIIFDRWGKELMRLNSLEEGWNGYNKNNRAVQEGVYVYLLKAVLNTGTPVKRGGTITLIR